MANPRTQQQEIVVRPPNLQELHLKIVGTAPLVQLRFSEKAKLEMETKQKEGSTGAVSRRKREPKDFEAAFRASYHVSEEGWYGVPAPAFRNAMIDACRLVQLEMTRAKMAIFVLADGLDASEGTPLVRLTAGEPEMRQDAVRQA